MTIKGVCRVAGMTRQNYYKSRKVRHRREVDERLVISLVQSERSMQPQLGCRKLLRRIKGKLQESGVNMGRDLFFEFMHDQDLLIKRRRRSVTTTNSRHNFAVYKNLLKDATLTGCNQGFVSDITYIRTDEGFVFLSLMMDAYSRKVVGNDCSDSLEAEGCLRSLSQAILQLPKGSNAIHHSDRGSQYCCYAYVGKLEGHGMRVSMTEENHCYENGKAERLNGILKQEYGLGNTFRSKKDAYVAVKQAIMLYNTMRPHTALGYRTPEEVHGQVVVAA